MLCKLQDLNFSVTNGKHLRYKHHRDATLNSRNESMEAKEKEATLGHECSRSSLLPEEDLEEREEQPSRRVLFNSVDLTVLTKCHDCIPLRKVSSEPCVEQ